MIVREEDRGAGMAGGVDNDRSQRKLYPALVAGIMREMKAMGLATQMRDPQSLKPGIRFGKAGGEELARGAETVELHRRFGTLAPHGGSLRRLGTASDLNRLGFDS